MEDRSKARDPGPSTSTSWPLASGPSSWPTCFLGSKSKNGPQENCQFVAHFVHLPSQRVPHQCIPSIWGSGGVSSHLVLGFAAQPLPPPRALLGGVGVWAKLVASLAACQLPAICSVLLDWFGTGAPKRAAWLMGPHHKPVAVCNFALTPRRTSV